MPIATGVTAAKVNYLGNFGAKKRFCARSDKALTEAKGAGAGGLARANGAVGGHGLEVLLVDDSGTGVGFAGGNAWGGRRSGRFRLGLPRRVRWRGCHLTAPPGGMWGNLSLHP